MLLQIVFGFLLISTSCCYGGDLPSYIQKCYRNDPNVDACILESANNAIPLITKGIPEFGVAPVEPLFLERVDTITSGLKFIFLNVTMRGFSKTKVVKFNSEIDKDSIVFKLAVECFIDCVGKYSISGNFLFFNVDGQGDYTIKFGKTPCTVTYRHKFYKKNGEKYATIVPDSYKCIPGKGPVHFDNLFGGNKILGDIINQLLNDNFEILANQGISQLTDVIAKTMQKEYQKLYDNVPFDKIFPENAPE